MATFHGNAGIVKVAAAAVAEVDNWSIEETIDTVDDSAMGDASATHLTGLKRWTGSLACHWDDTDATGQEALLVGASVALSLLAEGDAVGKDKMSGTATITRVGVTAAKDGIVSRSFDFLGNGALTHGVA